MGSAEGSRREVLKGAGFSWSQKRTERADEGNKDGLGQCGGPSWVGDQDVLVASVFRADFL